MQEKQQPKKQARKRHEEGKPPPEAPAGSGRSKAPKSQQTADVQPAPSNGGKPANWRVPDPE
eukprot:310339-Heterocapsa_arctica.AAC.1